MKKVLLVDDHPVVRNGIAALLEKLTEPIEVARAASCEEAFTVLEKDGVFDLVLMDLLLPGLSGAEGIRKLRQDYPELPVVALSTRKDSKTIRATIDSGAMGFIPKTHSDEMLLAALEFILIHKGIYLPPEILADEAAVSEDPSPPAIALNVTTVKNIGLTQRQGDVLYQILKGGNTNKEIARALGIAESTVRIHVNHVLRVLKVTNRTQAVMAAYRMKLVFGEGPGARVKYSCPECGIAAWGRGGLQLVCGSCNKPMQDEDDTDAGATRN